MSNQIVDSKSIFISLGLTEEWVNDNEKIWLMK